MKPTMELRFVEREVSVPVNGKESVWTFKTFRILQQKWVVENPTDALHNNVLDYEWRDVPVEKEQP